jgi:hypothetical protein
VDVPTSLRAEGVPSRALTVPVRLVRQALVRQEHVIAQTATLEQTISTILDMSGLASLAPLTPCPARCPRCAAKQATRDAGCTGVGCHNEVGRREA